MNYNLVQDAKNKIYNSELMKYVKPEKIEEAFKNIYVYNDREEMPLGRWLRSVPRYLPSSEKMRASLSLHSMTHEESIPEVVPGSMKSK